MRLGNPVNNFHFLLEFYASKAEDKVMTLIINNLSCTNITDLARSAPTAPLLISVSLMVGGTGLILKGTKDEVLLSLRRRSR